MTPLQLLALICVFAVVRVAISIKPEKVPVAATPLLADGAIDPASGLLEPAPSARTIIREYLDAAFMRDEGPRWNASETDRAYAEAVGFFREHLH